MLSLTRWLIATIVVVAPAAGSAAVATIAPARDGSSVVAAGPSAQASQIALASSISVVKHARSAWQSNVPITPSAIVHCGIRPLGDDDLTRVPRDPRELRIVVSHDATGPPVSRVT